MDACTDFGNGIIGIDSGCDRAGLNAVHLIKQGARAALVDTATNSCVPRIMAALAEQGVAPEQVDYIILTHIHLDHAGAASTLMRLLPQARLVVHPRGLRHMADPAKLMAATIDVYGLAEVQRVYGEILPIDEQRILAAPLGESLDLNGRGLLLLDTPGHARHHLCIHDSRTGHIFSGDTFGLSYRDFDRDGRAFIFPTSSPTHFSPGELHQSIDLLMSHAPAAIYLTHFSQVRDTARLAADLHRLIDAHVALALRVRDQGVTGEVRHVQLKQAIVELAEQEAREQGWALQGADLLPILGLDIELNAQGLACWLDGQANPGA